MERRQYMGSNKRREGSQRDVEKHAVVDREAEEQADDHEVGCRLEGAWVEPEHARLFLQLEHAVRGVEHKLGDEREKLLGQPPLVHSLLAHERHLERLEEVPLLLPADLGQRVLEQVRSPQPQDACARVQHHSDPRQCRSASFCSNAVVDIACSMLRGVASSDSQ
eukprot:1292771-Rhodomonas_salina.4